MKTENGFENCIVKLKEIADKIGALPLGVFKGSINDMVNRGDILPPRSGELFRTPNGNVVFLYMPGEDKNSSRDVSVHMYFCNALSNKKNRGEEKDYTGIVKYDNSNMFRLDHGELRKLSLCITCYKKIGFSRARYGSVNDFKYKDFSDDHNISIKNKFKNRTSRFGDWKNFKNIVE